MTTCALRRTSTLALALAVLVGAPRRARAQDAGIPGDGLELWVRSDGPMKIANDQISEWTDNSPKANNAIHDAFGQAIPVLATANGRPTMRFSGGYTGFHFTKINNIRTVFAVLSKDPASCLPTLPNYGTPAKFWIGGAANPTYFHPEHGCAIYNMNLGEVSPYLVNGKTYLNGKLVDGRTTRFPFVLGILSIVSLADVAADTIARDRNFQDRSWQGDISELIIYNKPLDDATRVAIQNALAVKYAIAVEGGPPVPDGGNTGTPDAGEMRDASSGGAGAGGGGSAGAGPTSAGGSAGASIGGAGAGGAGGGGGTSVVSGSGGTAAPDAGPDPTTGGQAGSAGAHDTSTSGGCACVMLRSDRGHLDGGSFACSLIAGAAILRRIRRRRALSRHASTW
jgi:hypothetical protein